MSDYAYISPKKEEYLNLVIISIVLGGLFSVSFFVFGSGAYDFFEVFFPFSVFLFVLLLGRLIVMKLVGLRNGFELHLELTYFNQFWFRKYDRLTYFEEKVDTASKFLGVKKKESSSFFGIYGAKGLPVIFLSVFLYILTLGILIFPSVWRYRTKKIPHLHAGTQQYHEVGEVLFFRVIDISVYRISKALFAGFFYYFVFAMIFRAFFEGYYEFYLWLIFVLYWVAFFTLMPIPGTEGFEFFRTNRFAWLMAFSILVLGMIGLLVFENYLFMLLTMVFCLIAIVFVILWKKLME